VPWLLVVSAVVLHVRLTKVWHLMLHCMVSAKWHLLLFGCLGVAGVVASTSCSPLAASTMQPV
jgi:hypothetical protein